MSNRFIYKDFSCEVDIKKVYMSYHIERVEFMDYIGYNGEY